MLIRSSVYRRTPVYIPLCPELNCGALRTAVTLFISNSVICNQCHKFCIIFFRQMLTLYRLHVFTAHDRLKYSGQLTCVLMHLIEVNQSSNKRTGKEKHIRLSKITEIELIIVFSISSTILPKVESKAQLMCTVFLLLTIA